MRLTEQQLGFFQSFGFLRFPGLLSDRIERVIEEFERVWAENGGGHHGKLHDFKQRSAIMPFIDQNEHLSTLLDDPRILGIASSVLGDDFNYTASDGNFYVGDTNWHSDWRWPEEPGTDNRKYLSVKMAFYLDPVTRDTGCLRVIPGSHFVGDRFADSVQLGAMAANKAGSQGQWGIPGSEVPAVDLESEPGDLLLFNHSIKHSSWGGGTRRRMVTMNLEERYEEEDLPLLRESMGRLLSRFWAEHAYGKMIVETASASRMRHLEQRLANDEHIPALVAKARREMPEPSRS